MKTSTAFLLFTSAFAPGRILASSFKEEPSTLTTDVPCRARAWVRAPNLEPGQIVQGDVKVKIDGSCDEVSSYSLGLRFAERSWVKTRREGVTLPVKPEDDSPMAIFEDILNSNQSIYEEVNSNLWPFYPRGNGSVWNQYENDLKNPELWLVREEERITFESKYDLYNGSEGTVRPGRDIVKSFALLVPTTNYPPAFDNMFSGASMPGGVNTAGAEHIYKYFVDVTFLNGTQRQIDAGYTSFNVPLATEPNHHGPESVNATAHRMKLGARVAEDKVTRDEFTLEVTFPNGKHLKHGSTNNITIVSHQLGPGVQRALAIETVSSHVQQKRRWAATFAADNKAAEELLESGMMLLLELQSKPDDRLDLDGYFGFRLDRHIPRFSQDGVVENGTMFSTEPVNVQFDMPDRTYPPFAMYYQTLELELEVNLRVRNVSEEGLRPDSEVEDEEFDWTPALREEFSYLNTEVVRAAVPISVYREGEHQPALSNPVHYLSPEARAPVFVDPSSLPELLQMTVEDRNNLAPYSQAKIVARADDDVVKDRYYPRRPRAPQANYYVGNTWLRKALAHDNREVAQQENVLVVQA